MDDNRTLKVLLEVIPKMGKANNNIYKKKRHNQLLNDILSQHGNLRAKSDNDLDNESDDYKDKEFINAHGSRKILQLAKKQQEEIAEDENKDLKKADLYKLHTEDYCVDDSEDENISVENNFDVKWDEEQSGEVDYDELIEIDEEDEEMFEQYFKKSSEFNSMNGSYILADKVMAAIREKEEAMMVERKGDVIGQVSRPELEGVALPPKVIKAYTMVGAILKSWTHGKLPKLFKVITSLENWQDVLYVTNPKEWSPNVVYEATKLFVSNLSSKDAQKFINDILLERVRENIETSEDHSLNYHLYRALKKSFYKPAAFFKGFLFPLVETGCNIREAKIAGSVLAKVSVPALHAAAALSYLLKLPYSPATTVFIKILLEKKYALPYQAVDECVFYFMRFRQLGDNINSEDAKIILPVVWHKAFLAFAQHYKNDITKDQRDFLLETARQREHRAITPEIRRELLSGQTKEFLSHTGNKDDLMIDVQ